MIERIVLIGFSGAGKSTVGRALSSAMGWRLIDVDAEIERHAGYSIPKIFTHQGETEFRRIERGQLRQALATDACVIATGGGAVADDAAWADDALGNPKTLTVLLEASAKTLYQRLTDQQNADPQGTERPMLAGDDPFGRITELKRRRESWYRRADIVVPVERRSVDEIGAMIAGAARGGARSIELSAPGGQSTIHVGDGVSGSLGEVIDGTWPRAQRVWIIADENVATSHLRHVASSLNDADVHAQTITFPAGEGSKSLDGASALYDELLSKGIERTDVLVALGGGVAGDLVGFVAATVLRGVGFVQVPTSLLAMVDSSVGGKTGINHATGKNLIGAFHHARHVLVDPMYLTTLPDREYRSGWAEIIKHGLIEPSTPAGESGLLDLITENVTLLADRRSPLIASIIARNVEIKASVVEADEREAGLRAILNFGHTIGHAVEASGYRLLHGEAVAVGLVGAMRLGVAMGRIPEVRADEMAELLSEFGLPTTFQGDRQSILELMGRDKKRVAGEQRWVVPSGGGGVAVVSGVAEADVYSAIDSVLAS